MQIVIDLPDELLRHATLRAEREGLTLDELLVELVEQGLRGEPLLLQSPPAPRSPLPVARGKTGRPLPLLSNEALHALLDQEEATGRQS